MAKWYMSEAGECFNVMAQLSTWIPDYFLENCKQKKKKKF